MKTRNGNVVTIVWKRFDFATKIVFAMKAYKLVQKGCNAYLGYILDYREIEVKVDLVPVVQEFQDVFPEEIPSLPPDREVEFVIELVLETTPISISPFRMAPIKLKELKA